MTTTTTLSKVFSLIKQGYAVFPVGKDKRPYPGTRGHLEASTDPEAVATMFGAHPDAFVGIHAERSGIVVLDIDTHEDSKNGFDSLELAWLGVDESFSYSTPSGGMHVWYTAPQSLNLPPKPKYRGMFGVDRKSGSSYVVYYGNEVPDEIELSPAPAWLCDAQEDRTTGDAYEEGLGKWLNDLDKNDPSDKVLAAIERIPDDEFGHTIMVERQFELIRLAAEGAQGVHFALDLLRDAWLRPPYNTEDNAWAFDSALDSGVRKHGAALARIESLPPYLATLDLIGSSATDRIMGEVKNKRGWFQTIASLVKYNLTDEQVATLVWSGPSVRGISREWGIDYVFAAIADARLKAQAPVENPASLLESGKSSALTLPLLSDQERELSTTFTSYVENYLAWAETKVNVLNAPYHRQNALTVMSLVFGGHVFIPLKSRAMGLNLFQLGLGGSSTGKSESIAMRDLILKNIYAEDLEYNVGSNPSPEALQDLMLSRDFQTSFFNTDEAAAPLNEFMNKNYNAGMIDRLTSYYEGYVPPMLRRGNQNAQNVGSGTKKTSATTSFNISMFGTPDKVLGLLTRDQFESGFLARFCWTISDPPVEDDRQYEEQQSLEREAIKEDHVAQGLGEMLSVAQGLKGDRVPMIADQDALIRMGQNRKLMDTAVKDSEFYDLLQPSVRRLGDNIRKIATMLALADGSHRVYARHALKALELGEELFHNVQVVAAKISASEWQARTEKVLDFIKEQSGECSAARVYHHFREWEFRDVQNYLLGLQGQGAIVLLEATKDRGDWVKLNDGEGNY